MKEHELERIMYDFIQGEIAVLVATTIIETGMDFLNVIRSLSMMRITWDSPSSISSVGVWEDPTRTAYAFLMLPYRTKC